MAKSYRNEEGSRRLVMGGYDGNWRALFFLVIFVLLPVLNPRSYDGALI